MIDISHRSGPGGSRRMNMMMFPVFAAVLALVTGKFVMSSMAMAMAMANH
jgi:hypothetical protein